MKKINIIINIFIAVFIGVFIGHGVYTVWDFKTHPELYVVQSAPWYTSVNSSKRGHMLRTNGALTPF